MFCKKHEEKCIKAIVSAERKHWIMTELSSSQGLCKANITDNKTYDWLYSGQKMLK